MEELSCLEARCVIWFGDFKVGIGLISLEVYDIILVVSFGFGEVVRFSGQDDFITKQQTVK